MTEKTISASNIQATFPHKKILTLHTAGMAPTFDSLTPGLLQLNANATSVRTLAGDGLLGHLVLTIGSAEYWAISHNGVDHPLPVPPPLVVAIPRLAETGVAAQLR